MDTTLLPSFSQVIQNLGLLGRIKGLLWSCLEIPWRMASASMDTSALGSCRKAEEFTYLEPPAFGYLAHTVRNKIHPASATNHLDKC